MREGQWIAMLNRLIETCNDGSHGYETAAQTVHDLKLKQILRRLALERRAFLEELRQEVVRLGGKPINHGTLRGALHRGWMHTTSARASSAGGVLKEIAFGERTSHKHYEDALRKELPADLKSLVPRGAPLPPHLPGARPDPGAGGDPRIARRPRPATCQ
ncbi:MAG: ferritin-like domain-containing protein [Planctomycetota bacterium]|jgi:uncharacterized protein (TIGR02284 family)